MRRDDKDIENPFCPVDLRHEIESREKSEKGEIQKMRSVSLHPVKILETVDKMRGSAEPFTEIGLDGLAETMT